MYEGFSPCMSYLLNTAFTCLLYMCMLSEALGYDRYDIFPFSLAFIAFMKPFGLEGVYPARRQQLTAE